MQAMSSSLLMPIIWSASMPRASKIALASGLKSSEIRTFAMGEILFYPASPHPGAHATKFFEGEPYERLQLQFGERPIKPRRQRFEIGRLHRGARPYTQARRRIAVTADV